MLPHKDVLTLPCSAPAVLGTVPETVGDPSRWAMGTMSHGLCSHPQEVLPHSLPLLS